MTQEYRNVIILVTWLIFYIQKYDVGKIIGSKVYKLSIFEICN